MAENKAPTITLIKHKEYECKQSKYGDHVPKLPMRSMILAPSGAGKTVLLQNMILDIYRGCFNRIYIFSPSVDIDHTWQPVKDYIAKEIKPTEHEKIYFDNYDPVELEAIIEKQHKVINYLKSQGHTKMFQILICIDDFADSPEFTRQSKLLHQLYIRGRHQCISTVTSTQVYKAISPIIRKNITHLFVYRLRNQADLLAVLEEMSAVYDTKTLMQLYKLATDEAHSFLYINLMSRNKENMFYINFTKSLIPR
jgi:hypothetical protein